MDTIREAFKRFNQEYELTYKKIGRWDQSVDCNQSEQVVDKKCEVQFSYESDSFIGVFIPYIDPLYSLYSASLINDAEEYFRRTLIDNLTSGPITTFIGKRGANRFANYLIESGTTTHKKKKAVELDIPIACNLISFLLDISIHVDGNIYKTCVEEPKQYVSLTQIKDRWSVKNELKGFNISNK